MARRPQPLERKRQLALGTGRTPGGREIEPAQYEIIKTVDIPPAPRGLKPHGKREWVKIWDNGPWLNPNQDYPWVEQICRAYDDIDIFRRRIEADGLIQTGYAGQVVAHPLIAEIRKCEETIRKCLSILGYSPSDRARLGMAEVRRQAALQDYISAVQKNQTMNWHQS